MDYKKFIKSKKLRIRIMQALSFVPDKAMISLQYRIKTGRKLDLKNPERYTEKLQKYKLCYKNPVMKQCVDKYDVRDYVKQCSLEHLLNHCYGVFSAPEEIDYSSLPEKFVCKDTLGGGSTSVLVVSRSINDMEKLRRTMQRWVNEPAWLKNPGREWPYDGKKHRIIIEEYLEQSDGDLADYKFYCFDGKVKCFYVRTDYMRNHDGGKMSFFNRDKEILSGVGMDYCKPAGKPPELPDEIDKMIEYAEILSKEFPHVRVDLYHVDGRIVFGELTFFNASGYMSFIPDEFDFEMGKSFVLT